MLNVTVYLQPHIINVGHVTNPPLNQNVTENWQPRCGQRISKQASTFCVSSKLLYKGGWASPTPGSPFTAVRPKAGEPTFFFLNPKLQFRSGAPCTQGTTSPLGQLVLPTWLHILKAQVFMFLGVVLVTNRTRRFERSRRDTS